MASVWSFDAPFPGARWHDTWMLASMIILILFQVQTGVAPGGKLGFSSWIHGFENGSFNRYLFLLNHEPYEKNNGILMVESISNRLDVSRNSSFFFFLLMKHHRKRWRFLWPKIDHDWGDGWPMDDGIIKDGDDTENIRPGYVNRNSYWSHGPLKVRWFTQL